MKANYGIMLLALIVGVFFWPGAEARAQASDTLVVAWETTPGSGEPLLNALRNAIANDTLRPAGRVYKLRKGGFYWNTERIENNGFHLRIVGEPPGPTALENPAVLQMVPRSDGTVDGRLITGLHSVTLKNLWLTGRDFNGVQTYYQPIQMDASKRRFEIDNCVLEQTNFALIAFTGSNNVIIYRNNKFRNLIGQPSTQQWEGRGISIWADQDTVIVENNTFFNLGMTVFQLEGGAAKYIRFNHNTMVNIGRNFMTGNWYREAYIANNLIINGFWHGEGFNDYSSPGRDPRATTAGMFSIGALPSKYGPEEGRRIVLANTAAWRDPFFASKYADTIRAQYFVGPVTVLDFLNRYPQMVAVDTMWLSQRPNFPTYVSAAMLDSMWKNITMLRSGLTPATPYFYMPTQYPTDVSWPLPENFSYTTPAQLLTAGTDGFPLGDLNWFPTQKAQWEAQGGNIWSIERLGGPRITYEPLTTVEAEAGTLGGTAAVEAFQGFSYFQMDGGGWIQWDFDLPTGGEYDLNVWTHMRGNSMRGQRIIVNGVSIHDPRGWGEYIWDTGSGPQQGMPTNEWTWTRIRQSEILEAGALTFPAGANKIRIEQSWGWQNFAGIDLLTPGTTTVVKSLRAPDATYDIVIPRGEGAPYVPQGFKSVALGTNGSISWTFDVASAGTYKLQIYYQNYSGAQTGQLRIGSTTVPVSFESKADSTGLNLLSGGFTLAAGQHTISLSGSAVKIDYVQLNKETITSISGERDLPYTFALEQNYPNPFNPATTIKFSLGKASTVKLLVYNILGQKVATVLDSHLEAGVHTVLFDASRLSTGVYIYRLEAGDFRSQKKMILVR